MFTLRELLEATLDTTLLSLDLREGYAGKLIKAYKIGAGVNEDNSTTHERYRVMEGQLELVDARINHHGETTRNGSSETGWGTDFSKIPKDLLDCYVAHFWQSSDRNYPGRNGHHIYASIFRRQQTLLDQLKGGTP